MYIRTHPSDTEPEFINNGWERTRMRANFGWSVKSRTLSVREKKNKF